LIAAMIAGIVFSPTQSRLRNEKATRQLGGLFFQGRIVLTEGKFRQNFLAKSYGSKNSGVKRFFNIKCLSFQLLINIDNNSGNRIKMRKNRLFLPVTCQP
jgi:hypothetical protein